MRRSHPGRYQADRRPGRRRAVHRRVPGRAIAARRVAGTATPSLQARLSGGLRQHDDARFQLEPERDGTITPLGTTPTDPGTVDAAVSSDGQYQYVLGLREHAAQPPPG